MKVNIKKRRMYCWTILIFTIIILWSPICIADDIEEEKIGDHEIQNEVIQTAGKVVEEPKLNARAAIIYDRKTR